VAFEIDFPDDRHLESSLRSARHTGSQLMTKPWRISRISCRILVRAFSSLRQFGIERE